MKKTYKKPELNVEQFDVEDVITASAPGNNLDMVGDGFENPIDLGGLNSAPGND